VMLMWCIVSLHGAVEIVKKYGSGLNHVKTYDIR